jgi:hypothetical protein
MAGSADKFTQSAQDRLLCPAMTTEGASPISVGSDAAGLRLVCQIATLTSSSVIASASEAIHPQRHANGAPSPPLWGRVGEGGATRAAAAATPLPSLESELRSPRTPQGGRERTTAAAITHASTFPRRNAPELRQATSSRPTSEGAGKAGCRCTRSLVCKMVNTRVSHHRCRRISPAFPARWF